MVNLPQRDVPAGWLPLSEQIYVRLKREIADGNLPPGHFCREVELGRQFGVSRTPIREAMRRLQAEGVLEATPRGLIVATVDIGHLADAYEVRAMMEGMAARLAAQRRSAIDVVDLRHLLHRMEIAIEDGDEPGHAALNSQFHRTVARASRNSYLVKALDDIAGLFERHRLPAVANPGRRTQSHQEHRDLADAIERQEGDTATEVAERHVRHALEFRIAAGQLE